MHYLLHILCIHVLLLFKIVFVSCIFEMKICFFVEIFKKKINIVGFTAVLTIDAQFKNAPS